MRLLRAAGLAGVLFTCGLTTGVAQTCLGYASFATGKYRAGFDLETGDGVTSVGGTFASGRPDALFGRLGAFYVDAGDGAFALQGQGGFELRLEPGSRLRLCPLADVTVQFGPSGFTVWTLRGGAQVGAAFNPSPDVTLVPSGGLLLANGWVSGNGVSESDFGAFIDLGLGIVVSRRYTIRPGVLIPLGFGGSDARFTLAATVNFGGGAGRARRR